MRLAPWRLRVWRPGGADEARISAIATRPFRGRIRPSVRPWQPPISLSVLQVSLPAACCPGTVLIKHLPGILAWRYYRRRTNGFDRAAPTTNCRGNRGGGGRQAGEESWAMGVILVAYERESEQVALEKLLS